MITIDARLAIPLFLLAILFAPACKSRPEVSEEPVAPGSGARIYEGIDGYHRKVNTGSQEAQRWFDQGLQLVYGFNHDEAIRSFQQAAAIDSDCVMAWWGIAYATGIHINNLSVSEEYAELGQEAAQQALARASHAAPVEQMLAEAVAKRCVSPPPEDRSELEQAYADAMEAAWKAFPNDPDVGALFGEALMDLQPWEYWDPTDGAPLGRTREVCEVLERVLEIAPDHPGANHFYIHTMESSFTPEKAVASADRLVDLVPGAAHLLHMPSHIYARVGRYAEASDANVRAIAADRTYLALAPEPEMYGMYVGHNFSFLAFTSMMEGSYEVALQAANDVHELVPEELAEVIAPFLDPFLVSDYEVMMRFGKWDDILARSKPPEYRRFARPIHHYARGVALSALERTEEARSELEAFDMEVTKVPEDWSKGAVPCTGLLVIARQMLVGAP